MGIKVKVHTVSGSCVSAFEQHQDRIAHFERRIKVLGLSPEEMVIVLLNMEDPFGGPLGERLMPGRNWQQFRDRGQTPYARGFVYKAGVANALELLDVDMANTLRTSSELLVLVMTDSTSALFHMDGLPA